MPVQKHKSDHPLIKNKKNQKNHVTEGDVQSPQKPVTDGDVETVRGKIGLHSPGDGSDEKTAK